MVFHTILALRKLRPVTTTHLHVDREFRGDPYPGWKNGAGVACGPLGNNCAVEGHGGRGPGPMPLPGGVRAIFHNRGRNSHSHDGDHSLFDLSQARFALSSGHSASQALPQVQRGFGSSAYQAAATPLYSTAHLGHVAREASNQTRSSFYGGFSVPTNVDVRSAWGQSAHGAQFSSASAVSQRSSSSFHFGFHEGVISMSSVAVVSGLDGKYFDGHGRSNRNSYSWKVTAPHDYHLDATVMPSWNFYNNGTQKSGGALAPPPSTQAPADSPAGYSSI
jgi:hypothetical protein